MSGCYGGGYEDRMMEARLERHLTERCPECGEETTGEECTPMGHDEIEASMRDDAVASIEMAIGNLNDARRKVEQLLRQEYGAGLINREQWQAYWRQINTDDRYIMATGRQL